MKIKIEWEGVMMLNNDQHGTKEQIRADNMHQMCKHHMYYHVVIKTNDGQQVEGIITDLDKKNVYMLVPQDMMPIEESEQDGAQTGQPQQQQQQQMTQQPSQQGGQQNQRQWYGGPRYRRFYRQIFPLATLAALSLYPYYPPYPYPPYPYPYYPYPYPYY
jgi:hypothetical protein